MISALGRRINAGFRATAPDPFVLAVLLTGVTFALVLWRTEMPFGEAVDVWAGPQGVWSAGMLRFAMQMCLILVTGHALASSPPVSRALSMLAALPRSAVQAVMLVAFVAASLAVLNWGLGLIAGAIMAKRVGTEMERRGVAVHYPLLAAAGYVGLLVWHGGFSGSAPLKVTLASEIRDIFGDNPPFEALAIQQTILSPMNLVITGGLLIGVPVLLALMNPRAEHIEPASHFGITHESGRPHRTERAKPWLPRLLEDSPIVTALLATIIAIWALHYYLPGVDQTTGLRPPSGITRLTPDTVNMTFLLLGLILHGTPMSYVRSVEDAARGCAGIILQFPLYAGIMGLMAVSGLTAQLADSIASASNQQTLPLLTLLSAGVVNLFVPSGGGQWAVQGPIAMRAALDAGVDPAKMVMAVAYGDELTNMLQPFWALPLLAITGVKARDMVGYTAIVMVFAAVWMGLWLLVF
ncbi:MAG: short-chain fatty acid transporter [Planctomycetota bacterium]|nr:MAG: short-chain fatty acid transporter [Planctomycetota bacterium]